MRSARSRTWLADSSPLTTRAGVSLPAAHRWATSSRSVDLPTPGSPATSTTAPGTNPPPSTRSSSGTLVGRALAGAALISGMGRAGSSGVRGATARNAGGLPVLDSTIEPHAPQSGQRPTHFGGRCPQASHSNADRVAARGDVVTPGKLADGYDGNAQAVSEMSPGIRGSGESGIPSGTCSTVMVVPSSKANVSPSPASPGLGLGPSTASPKGGSAKENPAPHAGVDGAALGAALVAEGVLGGTAGVGVADPAAFFPFGEAVALALAGAGDAGEGEAEGGAVGVALGVAAPPTNATAPVPLVTFTQVSETLFSCSLKRRTSSGMVLPGRYPCGPL